MSGPKEAVWYFVHDPTPTRLDDLEHFASKQDTWLEKHGSFIKRYLGDKAFAAAIQARHRIDECISMGDPDTGFDAYGAAWQLFNELHQQAREEKQREDYNRHQEQFERQRTATKLLSECRALWEDAENQALLKRWVDPKKLQKLLTSLESTASGAPEEIQQEAMAWQKRFDQTLREATKAAQENTKAVQDCMPKLQAVLETLGKLNTDALDNMEKFNFRLYKKRLQQKAEDAFQEEDLPLLVRYIESLNNIATEYGQKVKTAEFRKATEVVRSALSKCGYSVSLRTEASGTTVLQATGFPFKSVDVEMNPGTEGMKLNVVDERGSHCVKDVQSLQTELARQGLCLKITDWGKGNPRTIEQRLNSNLTVGGLK